MEVIAPWTESIVEHGFIGANFKAYIYFEEYICTYIWRGQM